MAESNNIMGIVAAFIGIAIMLGIGIQILGNSTNDCTSLPDWNSTTTNSFGNETVTPVQTGWAAACENANTQTQSAYSLILIILIVVAAVAILFVVRML